MLIGVGHADDHPTSEHFCGSSRFQQQREASWTTFHRRPGHGSRWSCIRCPSQVRVRRCPCDGQVISRNAIPAIAIATTLSAGNRHKPQHVITSPRGSESCHNAQQSLGAPVQGEVAPVRRGLPSPSPGGASSSNGPIRRGFAAEARASAAKTTRGSSARGKPAPRGKAAAVSRPSPQGELMRRSAAGSTPPERRKSSSRTGSSLTISGTGSPSS